MRPLALALAAWACITGCSRSSAIVFPLLDTADPGVPEVWVSPNRISFEARSDIQYDTFSIGNVGDGVLAIEQVIFEGDTHFTLTGDSAPSAVAPGTSAEVVVGYESGDSWATANIWVHTDDPDNPIEQIFLEGEPMAPALYVTPTHHEFGELTPGCDDEVEVVLFNLGKADLELQNLQFSSESQWLRVSQAPELPLTLSPGEATTVHVTFSPEAEGEDLGTLTIFSNDPDALATVTQEGQAAWEWVQLDGYDLLPVDLVITVELSASMRSIIEDLTAYVGSLVEALDAAGLDWQASVLARDDACVHAGPVDPDSADPVNTIADAMEAFWTLQYSDELLSLLYQAILRVDDGDCNEDVLREGSVLHGIFVTNSAHTGPESWDYYVDELLEQVGYSELLVLSAMAGDLPSGCSDAEAGSGYSEAVEATGGAWLSICSERKQLDELVVASRRAVVQLPSAADPDTLGVTVDGVGWTDGWRLDSSRDLVVFDTQPDAEAEVSVSYGVAGCD